MFSKPLCASSIGQDGNFNVQHLWWEYLRFMCIQCTGNVYNACDTIIILLYSLKLALGCKFGRMKTYAVVERSSV